MAIVQPFRALRPVPGRAADVAAVPYDVVSTDEARALAAHRPLSFLHVSRAELGLPSGTDPYADVVYETARRNFERLRGEAPLVQEDSPSLYFYRLTMGRHAQTGLAAAWSLDEYDSGAIKRHEKTRRDKEDDRTRHILDLRAQTGPVFLTYLASAAVTAVEARVTAGEPLFDFEAEDGVRHTVWTVRPADVTAVVEAFAAIPALYIADGHHRAASAARARQTLRGREPGAGPLPCDYFLAVAFPHDQTQVLPYNRIVKDLNGLAPDALLAKIGEVASIGDGPAVPAKKGDVAMFLAGRWHTIRLAASADSSPIASLDVARLQDQILGPILGVGDNRTDKRIDFVGGARGTSALEDAVASGRAAVAFSMFPVSVADLIAVSDAGEIMPPKSTWFEPKLRDGLLIHVI